MIYQNLGNPPLLALLPSPPGRLLDCGCGAGDNARLLKGKGWEVTGITVDPRERDAAQLYCNEVRIADLNEGIPVDLFGTFDVIMFSHVLEHLEHPQNLLLNAKKWLSPIRNNSRGFAQRSSLLQQAKDSMG